MALCKLGSWKFSDEEVTLYWLSSPYNGEGGNRYITAYFKTAAGVVPIRYSWGTLPFLYLGHAYKDGYLMDSNSYIDSGVIKLNNKTSQELCKALDCIPKSLYSFKNCMPGGFENCIKIESGKKTIIIPCIEVLRSIYTPNVFLSNRLLSSSGLDDLIISEKIHDNSIDIEFSEDYPTKHLGSEYLAQYIWLKYTLGVSNIWKKTYTDWLATRKIVSEIPIFGNEQLVYKGISYGNTILALNIELRNLTFPFSEINYSHPKSHQYDFVQNNSPDIKFVNKYADNGDVLTPKDESPKGDSTPAFGASLNLAKIYINPPNISKRNDCKKDTNKLTFKSISKDIGIFTTQDWKGNGKARPIEASPKQDIEPTIPVEGLGLFCKVIDIIRRYPLSVELQFNYINGDNHFSILKDGSRRKYALAKIRNQNGETINVIEIASSDNWEVSVLIFSDTVNNIELAKTLIKKLSAKFGHWDKKWFLEFKKVKFSTIKHYKRTPERWAELILNSKLI